MNREHRRAHLLDAALRAFSARGYDRTSVDDILAEAEVARGTFYRHFSSKREVFMVLLNELFTKLEGALRRIDLDTGATPEEQLRDNLANFVTVLVERPALTRLLVDQGIPLEGPVRDRLHAFYADLTRAVEHALLVGQEMGVIRPLNCSIVARAMVGSVKEVFYGMPLDGASFDTDAIVGELWNYGSYGILSGRST